MNRLISLAACTVLVLFVPAASQARPSQDKPKPLAPVTRVLTGTFPIAASVTVPAGYDTVYVSGMVPAVIHPEAPKDSAEAYGDTEAQTESVLARIEETLKAEGLGFGDVVNMKVYLVGDAKLGGRMDFTGMMRAYSRHFGTVEQPNKPSRVTTQVAGLVSPLYLVEIEVTAAKAPK
jgi:enamine deaminase RidA (YjgF/YER057c/UK114 family)